MAQNDEHNYYGDDDGSITDCSRPRRYDRWTQQIYNTSGLLQGLRYSGQVDFIRDSASIWVQQMLWRPHTTLPQRHDGELCRERMRVLSYAGDFQYSSGLPASATAFLLVVVVLGHALSKILRSGGCKRRRCLGKDFNSQRLLTSHRAGRSTFACS